MRRRNFLRLGSGETIGGALAACGNHVAPRARTVLDWNRQALQALANAPHDAPAAALVLATVHTCMYNAWAAYDDDARQTMDGVAVRLPRIERDAASKASAMSHAACLSLSTLFPAQQAAFDACMTRLGLSRPGADGPFSPAGIGRAQADGMLDAWRQADGALPFALRAWACQAAPHFGADPAADALALHWCHLAHEVGARDDHDDDRDVLLYFVLSNALGDAVLAGADAAMAAAEVLRSFTGSDRLRAGAPGFSGTAAPDGQAHANANASAASGEASALGRQVGAQVFEKARRYWQGKL
jgi:hypothetical protein